MGREKISDTKARAIVRMRELGFSVAKTSSLLGVSKITVYDHINPSGYRDRLRRATTSNREKHPTAKECPKRCQLCKAENRKLYFHVLAKKRLPPGLWLCNSCSVFSDICDDIGTSGVLKRANDYFNQVGQLVPRENESSISNND